jgi:putative glycosyltransferase (TIGR04372 family)
MVLEIYLLIGSIIFFPLGLIISIFNCKIYTISNHSFGDFLIELSIIKKKYQKYKILVPTNLKYKFDAYEKILFQEFIFVKNIFISNVLILLSNLFFLRINIYDNKKIIIEPKHTIYNNKNVLNIKDNREYIIYKNIKNLKINVNNNLLNNPEILSILNVKKKIAIINPRQVLDRNNLIRNSNINNYKKSIDFLKKNNFKIFLFGNNKIIEKFSYKNKLNYFDITKNENKVYQVYIFKNCDLYLGSYSGMGHFTDLFQTNSIYVDEIFFKAFIFNKNSFCLPKKIKYKNKDISYNKLNINNLDSLFTDKNINKDIKLINVSENEIFDVAKNVIRKNERKVKIIKHTKMPFCLNFIPYSFFKNNRKLFK